MTRKTPDRIRKKRAECSLGARGTDNKASAARSTTGSVGDPTGGLLLVLDK